MDKFEELLLKTRQAIDEQPVERTRQCPSEEDLYSLVNGPDEILLREKYLDHVSACPYCLQAVRAAIPEASAVNIPFSEAHRRIFPLSHELDFDGAKSLTLFCDRSQLQTVDITQGVTRVYFDIHTEAFYHAEIDTGQVVWSRSIAMGEIILTDEEQATALEYGVAAASEDQEHFVAFRNSLWNDRLEVTLLKRLSNGRLVFHFKNLVKQQNQ